LSRRHSARRPPLAAPHPTRTPAGRGCCRPW
jgi:hypothetical protein